MEWTPERRAQQAERARLSWQDPAVRSSRSKPRKAGTRERMSAAQKGRKLTEEHKAKLRKPKTRRITEEAMHDIKSAAAKKLWEDPEYRAKVLISPSKLELSLVPTMESLGYWHSGAGDFWIAHEGRTRNPDFKMHGSAKVVEIYGSYWHREERGLEHETVDWYRRAGFECVIVWEDEVERLSELVA